MQNHWLEPVDIYCERTSTALMAEPLNAFSNLFFFIAAYFALKLWRQSAKKQPDMLMLVIIFAVVGTGSFLFHTLANRWSALADVIPIGIFIHLGLGVFLYRVAKLSLAKTIIGVFAFAVFGIVLQKFVSAELTNHSAQYFPAMILLAGMAAYTKQKEFFISAALFAVSLSIRSFDMAICPYLPIGIHYMWHMLNAAVMYYVFKGIAVKS